MTRSFQKFQKVVEKAGFFLVSALLFLFVICKAWWNNPSVIKRVVFITPLVLYFVAISFGATGVQVWVGFFIAIFCTLGLDQLLLADKMGPAGDDDNHRGFL